MHALRSLGWWWVAIALALVVLGCTALRWQGWRRAAQMQAGADGIGLAISKEALLAAGPPLDRERQERLWAALQEDPDHDGPIVRLDQDDLREGYGLGTANLTDRLRGGAATQAATVSAILAEGPAAISTMGWWGAEDPPRGLPAWATYRSTPLLTLRRLMDWWGATAAASAEPAAALGEQDRVLAAQDRPGSIFDACVAVVCAKQRDATRLWLATRERLPPGMLDAWLAEAPPQRRWWADGLAGERIAYFALVRDIPMKSLHIPWLDRTWPQLGDWLHLTKGHEWALCYRTYAAWEAGLRGLPPPPPCPPVPGGQGAITDLLPAFDELALTIESLAFRHRLLRAAAVLAREQLLHRGLPADAQDMLLRLPAVVRDPPWPGAPVIRYERLSASRFRLGCGIADRPPVIPPARWAREWGADAIRPGDPPGTAPCRIGPWWAEIDLAAIRRPPPSP